MTSRRVRGDRGETLLELVITLMIIGIAFTALMFGIGAAVDASQLHARQVEARTYLRTWAESIERNSGSGYRACPTGTTSGSLAAPTGNPSYLVPATPSVAVWNAAASPPNWVVCSSAASDPGWQRVTIAVTVRPGILPAFTESLEVAVRQP